MHYDAEVTVDAISFLQQLTTEQLTERMRQLDGERAAIVQLHKAKRREETIVGKPRRSYLDQPMYWFGVWDIARERSDHRMAEQARHELLRLGVVVTEYGFVPANCKQSTTSRGCGPRRLPPRQRHSDGTRSQEGTTDGAPGN